MVIPDCVEYILVFSSSQFTVKEKILKVMKMDNNSIKIELKMITIEKTYPMEEIYNNDITKFVENFNLVKFKCTKIEYHKNTGKISKITFEELE